MSHTTLDRFYAAFSARDGDSMAACYHPEARFSDPVFPDLRGERIGMMWRMLCERGKDLELVYSVRSDTQVDWEATYTFAATGRKVHNIIGASFEWRDGLIAMHRDDFDFWRWSSQALGIPGQLMGWTGFLRGRVQAQAEAQLARYIAKRGGQGA